MVDRNTLKNWFKTGAKPLGSQFAEWIDSFVHKEDTVSQDKIENLQQSFNAKANKDLVDNLIEFLRTKNFGNDLTFSAAYVGETVVKRIRRSGNAVSFEFVLNIAADAELYNQPVVLCNNIPDLGELEDEMIPLAANYLPAADEVSRTSSFAVTAHVQGDSLYCAILPATADTQLRQIILTGAHIINQENESNKQKKV
ncbi:hypothetical protein EZS27_016175 [termite gut metagenome]|uniref:Uncharacterized protein n=1 Tax=termite gut metagenome TaxID=433724 RepID=A0A5J4RPJ6_9ZZZZ